MNLFDIEKSQNKLKQLEDITTENNFWNDMENSKKVLKEINILKNKLTNITKIKDDLKTTIDINDLLITEKDEKLEKELFEYINKIKKDIEDFEIKTLLSSKYDINNAIITIHPGAGGTESCDWAQMLYRMYTRWALDNNYEIKELDYLDGEEAGLKSVTFIIKGDYAYGKLKGEMGVHRLVRISPFDSGGRRHTSFASLEVLPEITDEINSAVRITHIPTNIVVSCQ